MRHLGLQVVPRLHNLDPKWLQHGPFLFPHGSRISDTSCKTLPGRLIGRLQEAPQDPQHVPREAPREGGSPREPPGESPGEPRRAKLPQEGTMIAAKRPLDGPKYPCANSRPTYS